MKENYQRMSKYMLISITSDTSNATALSYIFITRRNHKKVFQAVKSEQSTITVRMNHKHGSVRRTAFQLLQI